MAVAEALLEVEKAVVVIETADSGHSVYKPWLIANSPMYRTGFRGKRKSTPRSIHPQNAGF